jgi:AraC-like DNA-binding protein
VKSLSDQLRLQTARQRMLMDGLDATSAAYEVDYESVSKFSRSAVDSTASVGRTLAVRTLY